MRDAGYEIRDAAAAAVMTRRILKHTLPGVLLLTWCLSTSALENIAPDRGSEFVDIKSIDPSIAIDLRYASENNVAHRPLYPLGTPALVRASVAERLVVAQKYLKEKGYGLKIWDAYRPQSTQEKLWEATHNRSYVADPKEGVGSMHTRGAAVDATLVDAAGREVPMPTDFDNFTPAALLQYEGRDQMVRANLKLLQKAMAHGGFYGLRTEWWHFCAPDWKKYPPVPELKLESSSRVKSRDPVARRAFFPWILRLCFASLRMTGTGQ
jgi:D-alanyl-D-alanine dipeptidase